MPIQQLHVYIQKADSRHIFKTSSHAAGRGLEKSASTTRACNSFLTPSFPATRPCARVKLVMYSISLLLYCGGFVKRFPLSRIGRPTGIRITGLASSAPGAGGLLDHPYAPCHAPSATPSEKHLVVRSYTTGIR